MEILEKLLPLLGKIRAGGDKPPGTEIAREEVPKGEQELSVTTFGPQRLMQQHKKAPSGTEEVLATFKSFLSLVRASGLKGRQAVLSANAATKRIAGVDCLKLLEG